MAWAAIDPTGPRPQLAIGADASEHHLCQQIPGCNYSKKDHIWRLPLTWPGYVCFRTAWRDSPIQISPELEAYGASGWDDVQGRYQARLATDASEATAPLLDMIESDGVLNLRPDQRAAVEWLATYGRAGIDDDPGNGKTPIVIRALQLLDRMYGGSPDAPEGGPLPALMIGNNSALLATADKFRAWAPELKVVVAAGTALQRRKALEDGSADVVLIGWTNVRLHTRLARYGSEALKRCTEHGGVDPKITPARCEVHEKELNARRWGTVICDEAHKLANPKAKWCRAVWHLAHHAEFFWALTGTPVTNNVADPWGIMHAMFPLAFPARSRYLDMFAVKDYAWHGGAEILGIRPDNEYAFHSIIQPYWRRTPKAIARPDQPPRQEPEFRYPELDPAQKAAYKQMAKEAQASINGAAIVSDNSAVKFTRLCQLASAALEIYDGEDEAGFTKAGGKMVLPSNKVDDLLEFLEDNPGQLVVAANSPQLIELAERKLHTAKITTAKIIGGMSHEAQYQAQQFFQNGQVRVILINSAGSESIDLQAASTIYFLQPDPSYRSREQKIGRVDRYGQQLAVRHVYAISPGTVDERLYRLGDEKEERAAQLTRDPDLLRWMITGEEVNWAR
jgi:SNF2 family DNA or RNA helicase